eukprot:CAMPEP_0196732960 /NCGR_PEP_ID=MMETSP1091-20130531/12198_1 /TAXON_ID=302021 /ORGANISM="Rhodomonas sp., Strain CCMP768" /LENGTH=888 /DNA_ID=CAMNT_0042076295 /DNA_START=301 /DNA_END=2967 /DNA_ORIENTATION=+
MSPKRACVSSFVSSGATSVLLLVFLPFVTADGFCEGVNAEKSCCPGSGGLALPVFPYEANWNKDFRAFLYIVGLLWCFVGVSVLSDVFMAGIEAITNSTYKRKIPRLTSNGDQEVDDKGNPVFDYEDTLIWNPAVANLTLMALGSSTPEILLSIIEIVGAGFFSGDLGPGTVVGSASFNLYMITAMCMLALADGEGRKIDGLTTFVITGAHSLFAYLWLAITLLYISPDVVELWEALVTLACFPWLTFLVWCADNNWFRPEKVHPEEGAGEDKVNGTRDLESGNGADPASVPLASVPNGNGNGAATRVPSGPHAGGGGGGIQEEEGIGRTSSAASSGQAGRGDRVSSAHDRNASRFRHRHNALSQFMGGRKAPDQTEPEELRLARDEAAKEKHLPVFQFCSRNYAFLETVGEATLRVQRGGRTDLEGEVRYSTCDDTAAAGKEYEAAEGTLRFEAHETEKSVAVRIIHDKIHNPDLKFKVALALPDADTAKLGRLSVADVTIIDMDGPGVFSWADAAPPTFLSSDSRAHLVIERRCGCTGPAALRVRSTDGSARAGTHYNPVDEVLEWGDSEAAKTVQVALLPFARPGDMEPGTVHFFLDLEPAAAGTAKQGAEAEIGDNRRVEVQVRWHQPDRIGEGLEEATWADQFRQALSVSGGEDVEEASAGELVMHYLSITWKLVAAFVPPPHYLGGWACFWVALSLIGVVTMFINDLASIFGCLVGLEDQVTAITIVALGTSLPDTFASVLAIRSDDNADNAVGNITGSNSINVFLGLGLPWTVAAIYWGSVGASDRWKDKYAGWERMGEYHDSGAFVVIGGSLGFNTLVFTILTLCAFATLALRRWKLGYEIGGPKQMARATSCLFVCLWLLYILLSSLQVYHPDMIGWES